MISVSNLAMSFGAETLFSGASFQLNPGERYGLVGANGSGKTTFLNILSGQLEPTEGHVAIPKRLRVGALRQDQFLYEEESILDVTLMGNPELWEAMVERDAILARAEESFDADRYSVVEETIQRLDGYTAEARAGEILEGLGIPAEIHRDPIRTLSGGFKLRVLLAQVLSSSPDVLFLDEPTNHLDILSIRWLETFLAAFPGPVVVISHDHRFLDNVATHILDVDYETVQLYTGNYSDFVSQKEAERTRREKEIAGREKEIAQLQEFVDRFKAKASKARQAQSKAKQIERKAEGIQELPPSSRRYPTFRFEPRRPSGKEVLKLKGIRKSFGDNEVLHGVDLLVNRGERVAILGPNGIGKSTLLKIAMGVLEPDAGEAEWGYEAHPGYFAQDQKEEFQARGGTAQEWLWSFCPDKDLGYVRGRMGLVLFSGDDGKKRVDALSGGEAARLVFARIAMEKPNVLVLDEPTNHLDLESIEALVEGLRNFDGTLILVSHDRWFVGELATRVVEVRADGIRDYLGTYEEYVHACGDDHLDADKVVMKAKREKKGERRDSRSGNSRAGNGQVSRENGDRQGQGHGQGPDSRARSGRDGGNDRERAARKKQLERESESLTARIEKAEARIREIDARFAEPDYFDRTPPEEVRVLQSERSQLQERVEELMGRWEGAEKELQALV
ncbi:MAG: ATP-binding cassette domain-containing protein [Gemmatimonadales bacterium]|nr:MAG: ATP-binding cassette domain-containing protein [Gemmatimonadales bacterium]